MKQIFILLILVLLFIILYGYYQFSHSMNGLLLYKEGLVDNVKSLETKSYSISTEQGFYSYIKDMYSILSNGSIGLSNSEIDQTQYSINIRAMKLISKYSYILSGLDKYSYNDLTNNYPNMIQTATYDIQQLNAMYYSSTVLNYIISNGETITSPTSYNCLLGYLQTYYQSIVYFNNKLFPPSKDESSIKGDDYNTENIDISTSTITQTP